MHVDGYHLRLHGAFGALAPADGLPGFLWLRLDKCFDRVQRGWTGLTRLSSSLIGGGLAGAGLHFLW